MSLQADLEKILEQKEILKEMRADLREMKEEHEKAPQIEELKKELKNLREEVKNDEAIARMKDEIANANDRLKLLQEILVARMEETEEVKVTAKGKEAIIQPKMKIQKQKS